MWEDGKTITNALEGALQLARLMIITLSVGGIGWSVALGASTAGEPATVAESPRSAPLARARVAVEEAPRVPVTLEIDGLHVAAAGTADQTAHDLLAALGVQLAPSDRLSVDAGQKLVPGMRLALDRGIPITVVDAGQAGAARVPRGTLDGLLASRGLVLGALDQVDAPVGAALVPGSVVKITRVSEREVTEPTPVAFAVETVNDPELEAGREQVETQGVPGEAVRTWIVRYIDGTESARSLASETVVRAATAEIRRVGTRPRVGPAAPAAPADIERIIRDAAARWGADPVQLLRVAWCESRFNPLAYNPSANDSGLFQFIPSTWAANAPRAGYGGASPFDAVANANTAAMMFSRGQAGQWTCK